MLSIHRCDLYGMAARVQRLPYALCDSDRDGDLVAQVGFCVVSA